MKDKKLILNLNIENVDVPEVKKTLIENGWFFKYTPSGKKTRLNVYLLEEDYEFFNEEPFCSVRADNKDEAFVLFLRDVKERYAAKNR